MRRPLALLLSLPLMLMGGVSAHWLAYTLAVPDVSARRTLLAATGHGFASWVPMTIGVLAAVAVVLAAALVVRPGPALDRLHVRPAAFVALPVIGFAVQEFAERLLVGYGSPWHVWAEPTFWRGLLLQVPFGLLAAAVAALLLGAVRVAARAVSRRRARPGARAVRPAPRAGGTPLVLRLTRRVRGGDALRFRGPPAPATAHL